MSPHVGAAFGVEHAGVRRVMRWFIWADDRCVRGRLCDGSPRGDTYQTLTYDNYVEHGFGSSISELSADCVWQPGSSLRQGRPGAAARELSWTE